MENIDFIQMYVDAFIDLFAGWVYIEKEEIEDN